MRHLNFLFHTNLPKEFSLVLIIQSQFHNWILHNEEKDLSLYADFDEELVASCTVEYALKATQVDSLLPSSNVVSGTVPLDFLSSWISWGIELKPSSFHTLKFTPNGLAYSNEVRSSQGITALLIPSSDFEQAEPDSRYNPETRYDIVSLSMPRFDNIHPRPAQINPHLALSWCQDIHRHCFLFYAHPSLVHSRLFYAHSDNVEVTGATVKFGMNQSQDIQANILTNLSPMMIEGLSGFSICEQEFRALERLSSLKRNVNIIFGPCNRWV